MKERLFSVGTYGIAATHKTEGWREIHGLDSVQRSSYIAIMLLFNIKISMAHM